MRVPKTTTLSKDPKAILDTIYLIARALTGNLSFGTTFAADDNTNSYNAGPTSNRDPSNNMLHYKASGTTPSTQGLEFFITSNTNFFSDGHIPIGFIIVSMDQAASLYSVSIAGWTAQQISMACNVASVNYRILII